MRGFGRLTGAVMTAGLFAGLLGGAWWLLSHAASFVMGLF